MQHGNVERAGYRHGDWGPAYLIQGDTSDIGVLRLRPGDAMPNHYHEHCDESFVVLEGRATLWIDQATPHDLGPGDVYRCPPLERHYFVNEGTDPFRMIFIKSPASPGDTITVDWEPGGPASAQEGNAHG